MIQNNIFQDPNFIEQTEKNKKELMKDIISFESFVQNYDSLFKSSLSSNFRENSLHNNFRLPITDTNKREPSDLIEKKTNITQTQEYNTEQNVKKKAGRKSLNSHPNTVEDIKLLNSNVHSKRTKDNVRRKVKVKFTHFLIKFLNQYIKVNWKGFQKYKFRTIDNKITKDISIETNRKLFNTTVREYLTYPVSRKFKCDLNQNKKIADKIIKEKPDVFKKILNMKIVNFYNQIYRGDPKSIRDEMGLNADLVDKNKNKLLFFDEYLLSLISEIDYLMIYYDVGIHFFDFYEVQRGRKSRAKKTNDDEKTKDIR